VDLIESQMETLDQCTGKALQEHSEAVHRLGEVPGLGLDSAQQIIAEVGPQAATFGSPEQLASWVGTCPGREESAEVSKRNRSPKGNRMMRRVLNQAANSAVKCKGSVYESLYRRLTPRLGHKKTIWAVANRLCKLVWKILHQGVRYIEFGVAPNRKAIHKRATRLLRHLRALGYQVQMTSTVESGSNALPVVTTS
jgi:transposase